jgi:cysteine desulfurase family protein (TIGR01976 family)
MTSKIQSLDDTFVHSNFPGLSCDWVLMDNAGGSQIVKGAVERITEFLLERNVQIGGSYAVSQAAADALAQGRVAAQTLVNAARPEEIVFGPSTTQLMLTLAAAMRSQFKVGDEIILTVADHESNIGAWERLSEFGIVIKFWPVDPASYEMKLDDLAPLMTDRTRLVCVHHVSNILGSINPIAEITRFVHDRGAKIVVDAVAYAPHRAIDVRAWDVDYYVFSLYKTYGPHTAVMYGKYDLLRDLDGMYHYFYGKDAVPGKLEPGNPNYELAYSTVGIVDYLVATGEMAGATGTPRQKLEAAFTAIAAREDALTDRLLAWLNTRNDCRVIGKADNQYSTRVPTIAFKVEGRNASEIARRMDDFGIAIRFGDFHSRRLIEELGLQNDGGVLRVSMVHYNTVEQVDRLTRALSQLMSDV